MLIVGDSIGDGAGCSDVDLKWYKYLIPYFKEKYGKILSVTNISMGGNTSYAGYVRTMLLEEENFDIVVVCYGQNDEPEGFSLHYESILRAITQKYPENTKISILESSQREYTEKMQIIQELCDRYDVHIADTIGAFNNSGHSYEELCDDGVHPNDAGHKVYYEMVKTVLDRVYSPGEKEHVADVQSVNTLVEQFDHFRYIPAEEFNREDELVYTLELSSTLGMLGIDYVCVDGENGIDLYVDGELAGSKSFVWDWGFEQRHIETMVERCVIHQGIRLEFTGSEAAEKFHGVILTGF